MNIDSLTIYAIVATLNWLLFWRLKVVAEQKLEDYHRVVFAMQKQRNDAYRQLDEWRKGVVCQERRVELFNRLVDEGLDDSGLAELDHLQRTTRANVEPPIDIKNEVRMAALDDMIAERHPGPMWKPEVDPSSTLAEGFEREFHFGPRSDHDFMDRGFNRKAGSS